MCVCVCLCVCVCVCVCVGETVYLYKMYIKCIMMINTNHGQRL